MFLGGSHEVHVRVLGGELLRAMVANDGSAGRSLEPGAAVTLHLPPEALRVLRPSETAEERTVADEETMRVQAPDEPVPTTAPPPSP